MQAVLARLKGPTPMVANIRRTHRTVVTRANAPAVHLVDGTDTPGGLHGDCYTDRELGFTVRVFERDDDAYTSVDAMKRQVMARLHPESTAYAAYPHNGVLKAGRITPDQEIADQDALTVDMEFSFSYKAASWSLEIEA